MKLRAVRENSGRKPVDRKVATMNSGLKVNSGYPGRVKAPKVAAVILPIPNPTSPYRQVSR